MNQADVLILGGGLVGATLALALAAHGVSAIVVDPADPAVTLAPGFDGRASAIASASGRMLEAIGVAPRLAGLGCPIESIRVSDGLAPGALDFAPEPGDGVLGTMYENRALRIALAAAVAESPHIDLRLQTRAVAVERGASGVAAELSDGRHVRAQLLIAAEGRQSPTREAAGIRIALVTSNAEHNARAILGEANARHIEQWECGASLFGKAPRFRRVIRRARLPLAAVLSIGDETRDLTAARTVGIDGAAVLWGYANRDILTALGPVTAFEAPAQVLPFVTGPR